MSRLILLLPVGIYGITIYYMFRYIPKSEQDSIQYWLLFIIHFISGLIFLYCLETFKKTRRQVIKRIKSFPTTEIRDTIPKVRITVGSKLVIGNKHYSIIERNLEKPLLGTESRGRGEIVISNNADKTNPDAKDNLWGEIFIHECVHAVDSQYLDKSLNEAEVEAIGYGLWQIFRQLGIILVPNE